MLFAVKMGRKNGETPFGRKTFDRQTFGRHSIQRGMSTKLHIY